MSDTQSPEFDQEVKSGSDHIKQAADSFRHAAGLKANEIRSAAEGKAAEFRSAAEQKAQELQARAQTLQEDTETYVRSNPLRAVGTALGVGFVLGLIFRR
ncbi:MAG: YqjD family protein [Verrucomicrobiales bacterium]